MRLLKFDREPAKSFRAASYVTVLLLSLLSVPQFAQPTAGSWSKHMGQMNWDDAVQKCKSVGMRLPTLIELHDAYTSSVSKSWEEQGAHWSSKEVLSNDTRAFLFWTGEWPDDGIVGDNYKRTDNLVKTRRFYVRCIR